MHTVAELRMAIEDKARAQRIATLRKQKRLTQQAITEKLGVAYRTYQTWESLKEPVMPDWPNLEKLARFHGVKPEDIIGETPDIGALLGQGESVSQLDRIEKKLDEVLERLSAPAAGEGEEPPAPARQPKRRPPLPSPPSKRAPRKRAAGSG